MKKVTRIFIFNIFGEFIEETSIREMSEKYKIKVTTISSCLKRQGCLLKMYCVSLTKDFKVEKTKYLHNPLFSTKRGTYGIDEEIFRDERIEDNLSFLF